MNDNELDGVVTELNAIRHVPYESLIRQSKKLAVLQNAK